MIEVFIIICHKTISIKKKFFKSLFTNPAKVSRFLQKILGCITVFNIDNNQKFFLSNKSVYYYDFWRSCDTEDWSNDAENTALIIEKKYLLTDIQIENVYNCKIICTYAR